MGKFVEAAEIIPLEESEKGRGQLPRRVEIAIELFAPRLPFSRTPPSFQLQLLPLHRFTQWKNPSLSETERARLTKLQRSEELRSKQTFVLRDPRSSPRK